MSDQNENARPNRRVCSLCHRVEGDPFSSPFCQRTMTTDALHRYPNENAPDVARTDAVMEAIALRDRHAHCSPSTLDECALLMSIEHEAVYIAKPLLAALADAERKLAVVQVHYRALDGLNCELTQERDSLIEKLRIEREHSEKLTRQLAAAEKRAKENR